MQNLHHAPRVRGVLVQRTELDKCKTWTTEYAYRLLALALALALAQGANRRDQTLHLQ